MKYENMTKDELIKQASDLETYYYTGKMFTKNRKGGTMGVKTINQTVKENEKSSSVTTTQEQKIGTSDLEMIIFHFKKI